MGLLKLALNVPAYVRIEAAIKVSDVSTGKPGSDGTAMKPADVAEVTDLENPGQRWLIIVNAAVKAELDKQYKNAGYVGKCFRLVKLPKSEGKRYNPFAIDEIKVKK